MEKYQSYKPSGVEWIGEIPEHWENCRLKHVSKSINGYSFKSEDFDREYEIPVIRIGDVGDTIDFDDCVKVESKFLDEKKDFIVNRNDILIGLTGGTIGKSGKYNYDFPSLLNQRVGLLRNKNNVLNGLLYHYVKSEVFIRYIFYDCYGGGQDNISMNDILNMVFPLPPIQEQQQIVQFLDEKTELIDKLISTKERKITLLKEQRTSLINQVVTKGLNPNVKMKESGVEWIGEIPEHWIIKKTKHIRSNDKFSLVDGPFGSNLKSEHYVDNGDVYIIESGFITSGEFKFVREFKTITKEHFNTINRSECFCGCIIMSKIGEYYGMSGILPELDKPTVVSGNCISIKISENHNTRFIHNVLLQHWKNGTFKKEVQQTGQPFISMTMVDNIKFPIPPKDEQDEIVKFLEIQTKEIDSMISLEQRKIDTLKEYRQSLISEVVTGKIKVTTD